ncbi:MAG: Unknown protein [uncultured Campylobacterales bacterium]|uniref:HTH merR-type domain-containing protein n=1 Tax=uncultured Campylobacterales bacterium TaxID=352960 RepID=A0A6S6SEK5_9BACT|nr:MAG: Unknown protein [uncultured Campylobacterales bacterium]
MKKKELASLLNVTVETLRNWEKDKPELVRLINLGLQTDKQIEFTRKLLEELEKIKEQSEDGKFNLK